MSAIPAVALDKAAEATRAVAGKVRPLADL